MVLLRWGGLLSVLDLERGSEVATSTEVEAFWLSDPLTCNADDTQPQDATAGPSGAAANGSAAAAAAAATLDVEMPWWLYGPAGMQLLFPSSLLAAPAPLASAEGPGSGAMAPAVHQDIELEFDQARPDDAPVVLLLPIVAIASLL